jgi:hypothetical protein
VHVEAEVDVARGLSSPDPPVLGLGLPEVDRDMVSWDAEHREPLNDLGLEVPLGLD